MLHYGSRSLQVNSDEIDDWCQQIIDRSCVERCYTQYDDEAIDCALEAKNQEEFTKCFKRMEERMVRAMNEE